MGTLADILNDELERFPGVKADQDYAIRKVTENFLSGNIKSGMSAEAIAAVMKKPVDNVTKVNIEASAEDVKVKPDAKKFSYRGRNASGIEVYETSEETKKLSYKERKAQFLKLMTDDYKGRTAKFYKNGHYYYALFDEGDVRKAIYGDKQSSKRGHKAIVNQGADGSIFELVENTRFTRGAKEVGKKNKMHNDVLGWDYFVKIVQVDGIVFDLLANVRKKKNGGYVYSLKLKENNMKAEPPHIPSENDGFKNRAHSAFDKDIISQPFDSVKMKFSTRNTDSNRILLAGALESTVQNETEANKLREYKEKIS